MTREDLSQEARLWRAVVHRVRWFTMILTFVAAVAANAVVVGYYAAQYEGRIDAVEKRAAINSDRIGMLDLRQREADQLAARIDERLNAQGRSLDEIKALLQDIVRRPHREQR